MSQRRAIACYEPREISLRGPPRLDPGTPGTRASPANVQAALPWSPLVFNIPIHNNNNNNNNNNNKVLPGDMENVQSAQVLALMTAQLRMQLRTDSGKKLEGLTFIPSAHCAIFAQRVHYEGQHVFDSFEQDPAAPNKAKMEAEAGMGSSCFLRPKICVSLHSTCC
eukprot:1157270-Pelagomonas_calceolata.AAC.9